MTTQRPSGSTADRMLDVGRRLTGELDVGRLLAAVLEAAREATGARYAAVGILDEHRRELAEFHTLGLTAMEKLEIGDPPRGHGILGLLIERPEPLRLHDVSQHPRSYGFPAGHPPMKSFLGAPILVGGKAWGNLYLTDKQDANDFDEDDVEAIQVLAAWAAIAIGNASRFSEVSGRERKLADQLRVHRATLEITKAIGSETDLDHILELIVKRGRALVDADSVLLWLRRADELELTASAGSARVSLGARLPIGTSTTGDVLGDGRPRQLAARELRIPGSRYGLGSDETMLMVPLVHRNHRLGVLVAFGRASGSTPFGSEARHTLSTFASTAAIAVAIARSVQEDRLQQSLAAAESERKRCARELHDETLQSLAALKISLGRALRSDPKQARLMMQSAVEQLDADIRSLRGIIADLRPAALEEHGLQPALERLAARAAAEASIDAQIDIDIGHARLGREVETMTYRVAQEALTNVVKHAHASRVRVALGLAGGTLCLVVEDDGKGIDDVPGNGYGLTGMYERAALAGGTLSLAAGHTGGIRVELSVPASA